MEVQSTEDKILKAAMTVFQKKGMAGARMQEIADEAQINKAMLHYYFKSKHKLFEAVFQQAFNQFAPHINSIFNADAPVLQKLERFVASYISFVQDNPYIPSFLIQEINNDPEFAAVFFKVRGAPDPSLLEKQIATEIEQGNIRPIDPKQFLLNLFSLTAFPFAATGLVKGLLSVDDIAFKAMMEERKKLIPKLMLDSIRIK